MNSVQTVVLNATQVNQKIDRLAFQIHENHYSEKEIILAGIVGNGFKLAELLQDRLSNFSDVKVKLVSVKVNKQDPLAINASVELEKADAEDKVVILVDDVLNSGKTLIYGIRHFLQVRLKALRTVALIDRDHKRFPIKADYVGLVLSTTLQEHIRVELEGEMAVYLE
ncbi:MAG: pyrimidine operon attenuation protein/uracil phosphoribosyltransferase [Bacteroidia bacterium]|jgi:pyrimidine operon attenuation protein/uracil phosphoribosyltransferase